MEGGHEVIELLSDSDEEMSGEFFQPHYTSIDAGRGPSETTYSAYVVDQNTADEIATAFRMGVLTNPHNGVTHRMARNSQRQSKIAQKARESQERNTERKDLEA
ncbi:hypothetical protein B0H11DRAFT_1915849 [Mycena galericulata]|nr:hypothetical protein B0H11DRAFT_1915849 [Mycena galericulata]